MEPPTTPLTDPLDPEKGLEAFEELKPRLEAIPKERLAPISDMDVELAATRIFHLGLWVTEPETYQRFKGLPAQEFDIDTVDLLEKAALTTLTIIGQLQMESIASEEGQISAELLEEALETRVRMVKLARYHFDDHPAHSDEVRRFGEASAVSEIARDLRGLAALYELEKAVVSRDIRHYRGTDAAVARRLSTTLQQELDKHKSSEAQELTDALSRAWTLLVESYQETRAAAHFLYRSAPEVLGIFPTLSWLGRRPPSTQLKHEDAPDDAPLPAGVATTPDSESPEISKTQIP